MLAGVDGCRAGWYCVVGELGSAAPQAPLRAPLQACVWPDFSQLLAALPKVQRISVDMPIGLAGSGARECDVLVRAHLGARGASVFAAPLRAMLGAGSHAEASAIRRAIEGKGMSLQAYHILPKVRDVDAALRAQAGDAARTFETHPEACFVALNAGRPLPWNKKKPEGRLLRMALLRPHFGDEVQRLLDERPRRDVQADDVLDALACLWSAHRGVLGTARCWPDRPPRDACGLQMAIHA